MSTPSLKWLTAFLATAASVAALPLEEKRALGDWVTATINGQVVSWQNDYSGSAPTAAISSVPASTTPAPVPVQSTPAPVPVQSTPAPVPVQSTTAPSGQQYIYATINGVLVSWPNTYAQAPQTSTNSAVPPPPSTTAPPPPPPASTTQAPAAACGDAQWITAVINGETVSWVNDWPPQTACSTSTSIPAPPPTTVAPPPSGPTNAASCNDVHIFLAKGNNEPYPGRQGKLVDAICAGLPSCGYEDILFYNPVGYDYCKGVDEGGINGKAQVAAYAATCPLSKLVLSGYSQGTEVVGNMLGGGGGPTCVENDISAYDRSTSPGNQIAAVTFFGNARHVGGQSYNVLNGSAISATNPRTGASLAAMNQYANVLRDYCDETDPICAASGPGPFIVANHLNYFDLYSNDAAAWVKTKLGF